MDNFVELVKEFFIPGSVTFLMTSLVAGVLLLYTNERTARWGRIWLSVLAVTYWLLSTVPFAGALESLLSRNAEALQHAGQASGAEALVILGGGSVSFRHLDAELNALSDASSLRVLEGARIYEMLDDPLLIVSGGMDERSGKLTPESEPMRDALKALGVPAERIVLETESTNTYQQALNVKIMLDERDIERFVLVTSPIHMARAVATFRARGLDPIPSAAAQHSEARRAEAEGPAPTDRPAWLPRDDALGYSRSVMREILALIYYQLRGWMSAP